MNAPSMHLTHKGDDFFVNSLSTDGVHTIEHECLSLHALTQGMAYLKDSEYILVSFSGAIRRGEGKSLPRFCFMGIARALNLPLISFSDPSLFLHPNLRLSWYAGNRMRPNLLKEIAALCDKITLSTGKKIILAGGSGGGFAALSIQNLMLHYAQTVSLVWNPQTDITKYIKGVVQNYVNYAYFEENDYLLDRRKVIEFIRKKVNYYRTFRKRDRACVVLMNGYDHAHLRNHLSPWLRDERPYKVINNNFLYKNMLIHLGEWGNGHTPPPKQVIVQTLENIIENTKFREFSIVKNKLNPENKKSLVFSDEVKTSFEEKLHLKLLLIGQGVLNVRLNLSDHYMGYQFIISLKNLKTNIIEGTSGYLAGAHHCETFFRLEKSPSIMANIDDYGVLLTIEDFFGDRFIIEKEIADCVIEKASFSSLR